MEVNQWGECQLIHHVSISVNAMRKTLNSTWQEWAANWLVLYTEPNQSALLGCPACCMSIHHMLIASCTRFWARNHCWSHNPDRIMEFWAFWEQTYLWPLQCVEGRQRSLESVGKQPPSCMAVWGLRMHREATVMNTWTHSWMTMCLTFLWDPGACEWIDPTLSVYSSICSAHPLPWAIPS